MAKIYCSFVTFALGYMLGHLLSPVLQMWSITCEVSSTNTASPPARSSLQQPDVREESHNSLTLRSAAVMNKASRKKLGYPRNLKSEYSMKNRILVAVITTEQYLHTRAETIHETWGSDIAAGDLHKIVYFVGSDCNTAGVSDRLNIVKLEGVEDRVYPPQRKVFAVLQYLNRHFSRSFQWFVRADDDVYIRMGKLSKLLSQLDPNEKIYLGHPGEGKRKDVKRLQLHPQEIYCIGGPGVVLSNALLRSLAPNLTNCLRTVDSHNKEESVAQWFNEDVELGRCVSRTVGVQCSTSNEAISRFFQDYRSTALSYHSLKQHSEQFKQVITIHPLKQPHQLRNVHLFYRHLDYQNMHSQLKHLRKDITYLCSNVSASFYTPPAECKFV